MKPSCLAVIQAAVTLSHEAATRIAAGEPPTLALAEIQRLSGARDVRVWSRVFAELAPLMETDPETGRVYFPVQMQAWRATQPSPEDIERQHAVAIARSDALAHRDDVWKLIRQTYPARSGAQGWPKAKERYEGHVRKGVDPDEMYAGVCRFARYAEANDMVGTGYVVSAEVFFGPKKRWTEDWAVTAAVRRPTTKAAGQFTRLGNLRDG